MIIIMITNIMSNNNPQRREKRAAKNGIFRLIGMCMRYILTHEYRKNVLSRVDVHYGHLDKIFGFQFNPA